MRRVSMIGLLWFMVAVSGAYAQAYPVRTVRIITPFPAGSGPDAVLRVVSERLAKRWGQQVLVDNRPGANGFIAIEAARAAAPDGHALVQLDNSHMALQPHLYKKLPYELTRDFEPAATLFRTHFFVVVPAQSPWRDMRDLVAEAKQQAGAMSYGSWFVGSPGHVGAALLEAETDTQMIHIPFKDMGQLYAAVGNGDVAWAFGTAASAGAMFRAKKVRFLAAAAPARIAGFEDVPTVAEAGGPKDFDVSAWVALFAPRGTALPILTRVHDDIAAVLRESEVRARFATFTFAPLTVSRAEIPRLVAADAQRFGKVIKQLDLSLD